MARPFVQLVGEPQKNPAAFYDPPWKRVLLRYLSRSRLRMKHSSGLAAVYAAMGWTYSQAYWKGRDSRTPGLQSNRELKATELAQMARILEVPIATFILDVLAEHGG